MTTPIIDISAAAVAGGDLATEATALVQQLDSSAPIPDLTALAAVQADRTILGAAIGKIEAFFKPLKDATHKAHKVICDREKEILAPLLRVDRAKQEAIRAFNDAAARARRERENLEAERRRQSEQDRAIREAAALEQQGKRTLAEAVIAEAITRPAPVVVLPDEVAEIIPTRRTWHWRVANAALVPREYLCLDEAKIGRYARAMKEQGQIAGIDIFYRDDPMR